jgi:GNAT superfamily N-acetyltransferase
MNGVRPATSADVNAIADLADRKGAEYQRYHTRFWRRARDARDRFLPTLEDLVGSGRAIVLVHEQDREIDGVIIGVVQQAPAVYDPGGFTCIVDDYIVARPDLWNTAGVALLEALIRKARAKGAVQIAVTCGRQDAPKRSMLIAHKYVVTSEWFVKDVMT